MPADKKEDELIQWKKFYEENNNHVKVVKKKTDRINLRQHIISSALEMKLIEKKRGRE